MTYDIYTGTNEKQVITHFSLSSNKKIIKAEINRLCLDLHNTDFFEQHLCKGTLLIIYLPPRPNRNIASFLPFCFAFVAKHCRDNSQFNR